MTKLTERDVNRLRRRIALKLKGWQVVKYGDASWEVSGHSPAGENIIIDINGGDIETLANNAKEQYEDFDDELHAAEIFTAKRKGDDAAQRFYASAPGSLRELLRDASAIKRVYRRLASVLRREVRYMTGYDSGRP